MKLNLGCGRDKKQGFVNVDNAPVWRPDVLHDLTSHWPWPNDSIDEIIAWQLLEHIPNLIFFMNEAHRVLKIGAPINITVPWWAGRWQSGDATHCRVFNHETFKPWYDWLDTYAHINQGSIFKSDGPSYDYDPDWQRDRFIQDGGFSRILGIRIILFKLQRRAG